MKRVGRLLTIIIASAILSGFGVASFADEPPQPPSKIVAPAYKGKVATEWIDLLKGPTEVQSRAEAAEALGFIARQGRMTYGGFSDVPIDSPDPPQLEDSALRAIVAALGDGLSDNEERVRASSAVAVSWIGPRAKACVPILIRLLNDRDEATRDNALTALGSLGTSAKEAIPRLQPMLAKGKPFERVQVAKAMRLVGATPDSYVPTLIEILADDASHYAAMELGQLGDPAVPALQGALRDVNPTRRQNAAYAIANMAGWGLLTKDRESVAELLMTLTYDENRDVVWYAAQALGSVRAVPERSVPALVSLLKQNDASVVRNAVQSLGEFGAEAAPARAALIDLLSKNHDPNLMVDYAIRRIGIDRAGAVTIGELTLKNDQGTWLFMPLCEYPELAVAFLERNPHLVEVPFEDRSALIGLIRNPDPRFKPLQELLYKSDQLPLAIMAELRDQQFLPLIQQRQATATAYEKMKLEACARACGAPQHVVTISQSQPGDFKPQSAWPGSVDARMSPDSPGHGDGFTEVIVTGNILREGGTPAAAPKFYRVNDSMLLGERKRDEVPIRYDTHTGRFVFVTHVFAAYSIGEGQSAPGPYQTGSSMVVIESEGCQPLQVQFYDEMPEVRIVLSARKNDPGE